MRKAIFLILTLAAPSFAIADHHALTLEATQAEMAWQITSIDLTSDESVITVERESDEGGRTYVSYHLSYDRNGNGGTYTANARGYFVQRSHQGKALTNPRFLAKDAIPWLNTTCLGFQLHATDSV